MTLSSEYHTKVKMKDWLGDGVFTITGKNNIESQLLLVIAHVREPLQVPFILNIYCIYIYIYIYEHTSAFLVYGICPQKLFGYDLLKLLKLLTE